MNQPPVYSFATSIRGAGIKPTYQQAPGPGNYDVIDPQVPPRKSETRDPGDPDQLFILEPSDKIGISPQGQMVVKNKVYKSYPVNRSQVPGPGKYDNSTFGSTYQPDPNRYIDDKSGKRYPGAKFGKAAGGKDIAKTVGPGDHDPQRLDSVPNYTFGYKFDGIGLDEGLWPEKDLTRPSPGSYELHSDFDPKKFEKMREKGVKKKRENLEEEKKTRLIRQAKMQIKSPGPGQYHHKPNDYSKCITMAPMHQFGAPKVHSIGPGPGGYEVFNPWEHDGRSGKSFGIRGELKESSAFEVPGPGKYDAHLYNPVSVGVKLPERRNPDEERIMRDKIGDYPSPGPGERGIYDSDRPDFDPYTSFKPVREKKNKDGYCTGFGTGNRRPLYSTEDTPAPSEYQGGSKLNLGKGSSYTMGMKTYKGPKMEQCPGPGEYETDVVPKSMAQPAHVIGTGKRSNLGVPTNVVDPPILYNVSYPIQRQGYKFSFGKEKRSKKAKSTPGPGAYYIASSIGVIPEYLKPKNDVSKSEMVH